MARLLVRRAQDVTELTALAPRWALIWLVERGCGAMAASRASPTSSETACLSQSIIRARCLRSAAFIVRK